MIDQLPDTIEEINALVADIMSEVADIQAQIHAAKAKIIAGKNVDQIWMRRALDAVAHKQRDIIQLNAHKKDLIHQEHVEHVKAKREAKALRHQTMVKLAAEKAARYDQMKREQEIARIAKTERVALARNEDRMALEAVKKWLQASYPQLWPEAVGVLQAQRESWAKSVMMERETGGTAT